MHFIKEIASGRADQEHVHARFTRYSRGEFEGPSITIKSTPAGLKISATDDYASSIGYIIAKAGGKVSYSGVIIAKDDVGGVLARHGMAAGKPVKKKGAYTYNTGGELPGEELAAAYSELLATHVFLEIKGEKGSLKTKKKPPKPGSGADAEFCSATLDASLLEELMAEACFDVKETGFKEIRITHKYAIKEIIVPPEYAKDYAKARIYAKRKGTLKRAVDLDGKKTQTEREFSA